MAFGPAPLLFGRPQQKRSRTSRGQAGFANPRDFRRHPSMTPREAETTAVAGPGIPEAAAIRAVRERSGGSILEFFESLLVTILLALYGTTFIVQAFKIPSESMEPTLLVGDHLLVNKFVFEGTGAWYEHLLPYRPIRHGDIVVFRF